MDMNKEFDLRKELSRRPLITAHRGVSGGNIPCNTLAAFDGALAQGADMIELDVSRSLDGTLYVFHPGMERAQLGSEKLISQMYDDEVASLRFVNQDDTPTTEGVYRLEEALNHLKGRCYINVDKFWENIDPISRLIRGLSMQDQVLVKTGADPHCFDVIEECAPDMPYMVILREKDEVSDALRRRNIAYRGAEVLFKTEDAEVCQREYIEGMHEKGLLVWVNAIVYNYKAVLSAGHNDDISVPGRMDEGWGWLIDRGFDIIQTDWPLMLRQYIASRKGR